MARKRKVEWEGGFAEIEISHLMMNPTTAHQAMRDSPEIAVFSRSNDKKEQIFKGEGNQPILKAYEDFASRLPCERVSKGRLPAFSITDSEKRIGGEAEKLIVWDFNGWRFDYSVRGKPEIFGHAFTGPDSQFLPLAAAKMMESAARFHPNETTTPEISFPRNIPSLMAFLLLEHLSFTHYPAANEVLENDQGWEWMSFSAYPEGLGLLRIIVVNPKHFVPDIRALVLDAGITKASVASLVADQGLLDEFRKNLKEDGYTQILLTSWQDLEQRAFDKIGGKPEKYFAGEDQPRLQIA